MVLMESKVAVKRKRLEHKKSLGTNFNGIFVLFITIDQVLKFEAFTTGAVGSAWPELVVWWVVSW